MTSKGVLVSQIQKQTGVRLQTKPATRRGESKMRDRGAVKS
jgi:hypothetical protein